MGITTRTRHLGISGSPFLFSACVAHPRRIRLFYLSFSRWKLGVGGIHFRTTPRNRTERRGAQRGGKIEVRGLQLESEILRKSGSPYRLPVCVAHPRRFRLLYLSYPRWVLGVTAALRCASPILTGWQCSEITQRIWNCTDRWAVLLSDWLRRPAAAAALSVGSPANRP